MNCMVLASRSKPQALPAQFWHRVNILNSGQLFTGAVPRKAAKYVMVTDDQKTQFEALLKKQLGEVSNRLSGHLDSTSPKEGDIASQSEPSTSSSDLLNDTLAQSEENLIGKIELALKRLDEGIYDQCEDCGGPIPVERLEAKPSASRCVPCQSRRDG